MRLLKPNALDQLLRDGSPIYVLNTSHTPSGDKGVIIVNFYDGNRREFFKAPPTWIPQCISDAIPPDSISKSKDFRQTLVKGMLTLVHPEDAQETLLSEEGIEEYEAISLSEYSMKKQNINLEQDVAKRAKVIHSAGDTGIGPITDTDGVQDVVAPKIRGLVEELNGKNVDEKGALQQLKRHASALSDADISFLISTASEYKKVVAWAKAQLTTVKPTTTTARVAVKKPVAPTNKKKPKSTDAAFDFEDADEDMTPEEAAADAKARAVALANQATHGQSKMFDEIDKLTSGKR